MSKVEVFRKEFGERLKNILNEKGMSQSDLAKAIGVDKTVITKYINDENRVPKIDTFLAICSALNVSTDYFLNEDISDFQSYRIPDDAYAILKAISVLIRNRIIVQDPNNGSYWLNFHYETCGPFCDDVMRYEGSKHTGVDKIIYDLIDIYGKELEQILFFESLDKDVPF